MSNLVIYYSWTGNTRVVAQALSKALSGETREIFEHKNRIKGLGFFRAGYEAITEKKSNIQPLNYDFSPYENIFIGTPVWASKSCPAINAFIEKADLKGKKVYLFATSGGGSSEGALKSMTEKIQRKEGQVMDSFALVTKAKGEALMGMVQPAVQNWVEKIRG